MKRERWQVCPECGSTNVHCDMGVTPRAFDNPQTTNTVIYDRGFFGSKRASLDIFVCVDCGNMKSFIANRAILDHIKQKWPKADSVVTSGELEIRRESERVEEKSEDEKYG